MKINNKGSAIVTTPIIIVIGLMIISTLIVLMVNMLMPYIWYEKLSSTSIKYVYIMEEYGYLTKNEVNNLKKELKEQGFEEDKISIGYTSTRVEYGKPIFLEIKYDYQINMPFNSNIDVPMMVSRNSVSKR